MGVPFFFYPLSILQHLPLALRERVGVRERATADDAPLPATVSVGSHSPIPSGKNRRALEAKKQIPPVPPSQRGGTLRPAQSVGSATPPGRNIHVPATSLPRPCDVPVMSLLCPCYVPVMSPLCPCYVPVMSLLCPCYVPVMSLLCPCYVPVMSLLCPCYVPVMSLLCPCYVPVRPLLGPC
jgi:hypothetical protein